MLCLQYSFYRFRISFFLSVPQTSIRIDSSIARLCGNPFISENNQAMNISRGRKKIPSRRRAIGWKMYENKEEKLFEALVRYGAAVWRIHRVIYDSNGIYK